MLTVTAEAMQVELPSKAVLEVYLSDLSALSDEQLALALGRCRREILNTYGKFVSVAQILSMADVPLAEEVTDVEAGNAWEQLLLHVDKHVQSEPEGSYFTRVPVDEVTDRIVRRIGGWKVLKCRTNENIPFIRKDFVEQFKLLKLEPMFDLTSDKRILQGLTQKQLGGGA
jgi:hypothetical protein